MKFLKSAIAVFVCVALFITSVSAQTELFTSRDLSAVSIDSYSDDQITQFSSWASAQSISLDQALQLLKQRGLPDAEIEKLKARVALVPSTPTNSNYPSTITNLPPNRSFDSAKAAVPTQNYPRDLSVFGSELFQSTSVMFEPNLRIATPSSYVLGPDDELVISVYGVSEKKYNLVVSEEGEIYIPNVGPMFVSGLTIEEASRRIKAKLASTIYRAINSGQTNVQISLGKIRSIRVNVIGQAAKPGTYTISSLTTLYNLLYLCGGPNDQGSFRAIEVIRGNEVKRVADLYKFLVQGNQESNILLQEGDVVRIPYYDTRVRIAGDVKRPGKYELLKNETFSDLLKYTGGFTDFAYRASVSLIRITDVERTIIDVPADAFASFKVQPGDAYQVGRLQEKIANRIVIEGEVLRPGNYQFEPGLTLTSLLQRAGGVSDEAYTTRVSVFSLGKNQNSSISSVNLDSLRLSGTSIVLHENDSIHVHSIYEFRDNLFLSVMGKVRRQGQVPWRENISLRDVLLTSGGVAEMGDSTAIEVSRKIRNANVSSLNYRESETFMINLAVPGSQNADFKLQPFDIVTVRPQEGLIDQRTVIINGAVAVPGRYILQKSGDRISDLIERAGRFKASADSSFITVRRLRKSNLSVQEREMLFQRLLGVNSDSLAANERLRYEISKNYDLISVDLHKALREAKSSANLILEDGDVLSVSGKSNLVKISGEVNYPTIIPFKEGATAKFYIKQAGSYTTKARKSAALVIYPDGKAKSVKRFLWFRNYPEVTAQSEVFVPQKNKSNKAGLSVGEFALVISALGIVSNVIIAAIK